MRVEVRRHVRTWAPSKATIAVWTDAALGARAAGREIAVSVVGPAASRKLNAQYRGRDHATNVLSFPAAPMPGAPLGDLVICPHVLRAEAQEQKKSLRAHWAHLIVHGALHLVGYDHERDGDARRMERREIAVLRRLGFPNPYRPRAWRSRVVIRARRQKSRLLPARTTAKSEKAPQATFSNESGSR